jgi:hypothetical protein
VLKSIIIKRISNVWRGGFMGAFYTNLLVKGASRDRIVSWLRERKRQSAVLPERDGVTPVFDKKCENQSHKEITRFAGSISKELKCTAWAVMNHDDGILAYWLFREGKRVNEYTSVNPAVYFLAEDPDELLGDDGLDFTPMGGDAAVLCELMGNGGDRESAESILTDLGPMGGRFIDASERHYALLEALGIDPAELCTGYNYLRKGGGGEDIIYID